MISEQQHGWMISSLPDIFANFSVDVLLKATGDAPIMKKKKWAVDKNKQVSYLIDFIKKYIKCDPSESLVSIS